jgi:membrane-bound lytic murein transglycosylase A
VAGRLRHNARFVILVPKSLDPMSRGRKLPVPDDRPSAKIARLFPQTAPAPKPVEVTAATNSKPAASPTPAPAAAQNPANQTSVPLPEPRPRVEAISTKPVQRHQRRYRYFRR